MNLHTREALDALAAFLEHRDAQVRIGAAQLTGPLGTEAKPLVSALRRLLENATERDDRAALMALRQIDPESIPESFRRRGRPTTPGRIAPVP